MYMWIHCLSSGPEEESECLFLTFKEHPLHQASLGGLSLAERGCRGTASPHRHSKLDRGRHPSQCPIALCDQGRGSHCHCHQGNLKGGSSSL